MGNFIGMIFDPSLDMDSKKIDPNNPHLRKIMKTKEEMNGWERVKMVFSKNELDEISPELHRIKDATLIAMFIGGIIGGVGRSRIAYMDFFRQNVEKVYETPLQAKRALQDTVTLGMGSGAFRIGWRISAFTFMYMTSATAISAYRGKVGVLDQVGGAGTAGFLYKLRDGPKAVVAGTVFGSALGLMAGSITFVAVKILGIDFETANLYYYHRLALKKEKEHKQTLQLRESQEESDNLLKFHNQLLEATMPAPQEENSPSKNDKINSDSASKNSSPTQTQAILKGSKQSFNS